MTVPLQFALLSIFMCGLLVETVVIAMNLLIVTWNIVEFWHLDDASAYFKRELPFL